MATSRDELVDAYLRGDISRRTFVRRLTALGVSLASAMAYVELLADPGSARAATTGPRVVREHLPPGAQTAAPTDISATSAVLHATVDPNLRTSTVSFEWGTDPAALGQVLPAPAQQGNGDRDVAVALTGLEPLTTYQVRVVATNPSGTTTGQVVAFATLADAPQAVTAAATEITGTSALLHATVDPDLQATDVRFEWGTSPSALSGRLDAARQTGDGERDVSARLTGLREGGTYHVRAVATSRSGEVAGAVVSFTTSDATAPAVAVVVPAGAAAAIQGSGLLVDITSPEDAAIVLELIALVPASGGRVRRVVVARVSGRVRRGVRRRLRLKRTLAGRRLRRRKGLRYQLRTTAKDAAGNTRTTTKNVRAV